MKSKIIEQDETFFQKLLTKLSCFSDKDFINPQITLSEYIQVYSRISFNFLLLIIIFLCGFLGFYFAGREFKIEDDLGQLFGPAIWALSLIFVLYNFTNKSREVCDRLFIIYNILVDLYFGVLIYDTNYQEKSFPFYLRLLYFYMLATTIFLLYRYETSTKELIIFIAYKLVGLLIFIFINNHSAYYVDFICEFGFMFFWILSIFIYKQLREDYLRKSVEFFTEQKYENQYYQGLINMINKSFLSLNISTFMLTFNNPFENFLKMLGLTEDEIELNLKEQNRMPKYVNINNNNFNNDFNGNNNNNNFQNQNNNNNTNNRNLNLNNPNNNFNNNNNNNNNIISQAQRLELTTQNDISTSNNLNTVSNLNYNRPMNSNINNNSLNNVMNSNALVPLNARNNNNQVSYNKLDSNSNSNSLINQPNNFNNLSNLNINSYNNNNNNNNVNSNSNNFNRINFGNNLNNPSVSNYDANNNPLNSSGGKNSNLNSGSNKNNLNFGNNFTFLNQANNNLRNNLNPSKSDRVYLNNSNAPLNNNNNNNVNNQNQQAFASNNLNANNQNPYSDGGPMLNKNIIFNGKRLNDEDSFINKLDYILNVFVNFYEEQNSNEDNINNNNFINQTPNQQNLNNNSNNNFNSNNNNNQVRRSMSEAIRDIFYSRFKLTLNDGFIYKGIYSTLPTFPVQMTVELYYRKILTYQGEIVEFYFNDITSTRMVETDKALNKIRSLVLAKISHEFKVPLITIIYILKNYLNSKNIKTESNNSNNNNMDSNNANNNSIVVKTSGGKNSISAEDYIRNTIDLGDYMLSLINDIIDYSIINSEFDFKCEYENFEFSEMMEFSFRILKILLTCKGLSDNVVPVLEVDSRIPQFFCNDEKRIKQILLNLITNSIKFTKKGFIKLSALLVEDGSIKVSVEDTGCGIEPEIVQRIFNDIYTPIVNIDGDFQKSTSGLGLSISKKIIDKIGNKIECSSIVNQKTIFSFVISSKEEFENNYEKNDNISYLDENLIMNRSGFTTSYTPINNNNTNTNTNNNFNNNNNFNSNSNNNNNNNNNFNMTGMNRRENQSINFSFKNTNLSERNNLGQFDRMKAAMNINRKQGSPASKMNSKARRNSNSEVYYFGGAGANTGNNNNSDYNSNNRSIKRNNFNNVNLNVNNNYNQDYRQTAGYEEEPTILQSPKDIPTDLGEIAKNNRSMIYNSKKEPIKSENYYELKVYIKPILKYFESQKANLILYVDDSDIIRKSVKRQVLSYVDFINDADVICCKDGAEAFYLLFIDQISNNRIKIIVSDDKMDLVNGDELYELIDKYTQLGRLRRIPFVLQESQNSKGVDDVRKINEYYFKIRKNPKKEDILKLLEIAKIR